MSQRALTREFLTKAVVMFVIIAGGVLVGLTLGIRLGFGSQPKPFDPEEQLSKVLRKNHPFPSLIVSGSGATTVDVASLVAHGESVVAFLSPGCGPCQNLVTALSTSPAIKSGTLRLLIVTSKPEEFPAIDQATFLTAELSVFRTVDIRVFPTLVLIHDGLIAYSQAAYDPSEPPPFLKSMTS